LAAIDYAAFAIYQNGAGWAGLSFNEVREFANNSKMLPLISGLDQAVLPISPYSLPLRYLTALYSFKEGTGVTVADKSGNSRDATITDGTWTEGLSSYAVECAADQYISIPTTAIDPALPWQIILGWKPVALIDSPTYNWLFTIKDTDSHEMGIWQPAYGTPVALPASYYRFFAYNGSSQTDKSVTNTTPVTTGYNWISIHYDPATGIFTNVDPLRGLFVQPVALTNVLTTVSAIKLNYGRGHAFSTADYAALAIYQNGAGWGGLTLDEVREFASNAKILPIISL
jgi:hypothetical protein